MIPDDREASIRTLLPLVRSIARRVKRVVAAADLDDLVGDGSIGLIRAVDTFDASRGASLETYARHVILGSIFNGLRRLDPVSERVRRTVRRADEHRFALAQDRGALPSPGEMERLRPGLGKARSAVRQATPISLEATFPFDPAILADCTADPQRRLVERARSRHLLEALAGLPPRERQVLALHYYCDVTLHAIGTRMCVSSQRISQLHLRALARLRQTVAAP